MTNPENLKGKGFDKNSKNINKKGAPKYADRRRKLKRLIKDLSGFFTDHDLTYNELTLVYDLYNITISDFYTNHISKIPYNELYFIESSFGIKIGRSNNVKDRIKQISTDIGENLTLIHSIKLAGKFEKNIHNHLIKYNIKTDLGTEWFYKEKPVIDFINNNRNLDQIIKTLKL